MASNFYHENTPDIVKNAKGLHLISLPTMNGRKIHIMLEELNDVYGIEWTTSFIDIYKTNEHKQDWMFKLNPNGKIPVLIDNTVNPPHPVMESSAELMYLATKFDKENRFMFTASNLRNRDTNFVGLMPQQDPYEQSQLLQWLFFFHSTGVYFAQAVIFCTMVPEDVPFAKKWYRDEALRLYGVIEDHLSGKHTGQPREYLAGNGKGKYSIADISTYPWVSMWSFRDMYSAEDMKPFPHVLRWIERLKQRPAVVQGMGEKYDLANNEDRLLRTT